MYLILREDLFFFSRFLFISSTTVLVVVAIGFIISDFYCLVCYYFIKKYEKRVRCGEERR